MDVIRRYFRAVAGPLTAVLLAACVSAGSSTPTAPRPALAPPAPVLPPPSTATPPPAGDPAVVSTAWGRSIDRLIGPRQVSVAVRVGTRLVYTHLATVRSTPASNQKVLLSMTALSELGPGYRIPTDAAVIRGSLHKGVVNGDLWIVGHGDPEFDDAAAGDLAAKLRVAGIRRITGAVIGDTGGFLRDRHAPGWHPMALDNIGLPTALSFDHNAGPTRYVLTPERGAARAVTAGLRGEGIEVGGSPRTAIPTDVLKPVASVRSAPLAAILRRQNINSDNLDAETLSKVLGAKFGGEGSIAAGASVIQAWLHDRGVQANVMDASGLSYRDRISTLGLSGLLASALRRPWGGFLRASLPAPGQGTMRDRLAGIAVRAKTGTLAQGISALSGYLRLRSGPTASFSILSRGVTKDVAIRLEDRIVRTLSSRL